MNQYEIFSQNLINIQKLVCWIKSHSFLCTHVWFLLCGNLMASGTDTTGDLITDVENSNYCKLFSVFKRNNKILMILSCFIPVIGMVVISFLFLSLWWFLLPGWNEAFNRRREILTNVLTEIKSINLNKVQIFWIYNRASLGKKERC